MVHVVKAEWQNNYKVYLEFNDGLKGFFDFQDKLMTDRKEIIRELLDLQKFSTLKLERHTVCWDNGVDFAPEYLHEGVAATA
jgi:hypothetical protein